MDEAPRVCNYCEANHTVQWAPSAQSKMNTLVQRTSYRRVCYSSFSPVQSLRVRPFGGMGQKCGRAASGRDTLANKQSLGVESICGLLADSLSRSVCQ